MSGLSGRGADDFNALEPQTDLFFPDSRQYETKTTGPSHAEPADLGGEQETDALLARLTPTPPVRLTGDPPAGALTAHKDGGICLFQ